MWNFGKLTTKVCSCLINNFRKRYMRVPTLILIVFFSLNTFAEITNQQRRNQFHENRNQRANAAVEQCMQAEQGFQDFVVGNIEASAEAFTTSYQCLSGAPVAGADCNSINQGHIDRLKEYRDLTEKLYEEAATAWANERSQSNDGFTNQCFMGPNNVVEFEEHIRNVEVQLPDPTMCVGERNAWMADRDRIIAEYTNGSRSSSALSSDELQRFSQMHHSPIMPIISDEAKWRRGLSDQQLQSHLASAFNNVQHGVNQLLEEVRGYQDSNRHQLYAMDAQLQSYLQTLDEESQNQMRECGRQTGFFGDCFSTASAEGRCMNRIANFAGELLPFWPIVDGMSDYARATAAENAGVLTSEEAVAMRAEAATMAIFGVGGLASGTTALARRAVQKVAAMGRRSTGTALANPRMAMTPVERSAMQARNQALDNPGRVAAARDVLGRDLTAQQQAAVIRAHEVGTPPYSRADLLAKSRILSEAGFERAEIEQLMRRSITGQGVAETAARPAYDDARNLMQGAGVPDQTIERVLGRSGYNRGPLSPAQTDQVWDAINDQANLAMRAGNVQDASRLYERATEVLTGELDRAVAEGANPDRIHALAARVFAHRNVTPAGGGARAIPTRDPVFDRALESGYFDTRVGSRGFTETFDPQTQRNMNLYDPRVIGRSDVNPEFVYARANRQYQELLGIASYLNRPAYQRPPMPDWLEGVDSRQVREYLQVYRRSMDIIEQQYLGR